MKKFFGEFKTFISKGNVMDLAVAFIIGAAFKAIVSSLVNDIIMPVVSLVVGEEGFKNYKYVIAEAVYDADVLVSAENAIYYGNFIQAIIDFLIIAFVVFLMVKAINKMKAIAEEVEDQLNGDAEPVVEEVNAPPAPTTEEILLDIKALLEKNQ